MNSYNETMDNVTTARAIRTVTSDVQNSNFVQFPYEMEIFNSNSHAIVEIIKSKLADSTYLPTSSQQAEIPKGNGAVRPGTLITIKDQLAYALLLEDIFSDIHLKLLASQGVIDFGYQLYSSASSHKWFQDWFNCWDSWKIDSLNKISQDGYQFIVMTDITGCYENIDHKTLFQDLNRVGAPQSTTQTLRNMYKRWNPIDTKGLPQAISSSHLLAKLYLHEVDTSMRNLGYTLTRYVDDIRIFCNSRAEAKRAIMDLSIALRKRGLNLQSSKTKILEAEKARAEIIGRATTIDILSHKLREEIDIPELRDDPYASSVQINTGTLNDAQIAVTKQAFTDYFLLSNEDEFDKSLFHYLINRLGSAGDDFAVEYCLDSIEKRPQETEYILRYLKTIEDKSSIVAQLLENLNSPNSVYDYQNYQISQWLLENDQVSTDFLDYIRGIAFDNNKPVYFRALAKQILGDNGIHTDLTAIYETYSSASSSIEKDAIICSLHKLETSQRNAIFNQLAADDPNVQQACTFARQINND